VAKWLEQNLMELLAVYCLDFAPVRERLRALYSENPRNTPYDPCAVVRSLLLMMQFGETSVTKWAKRVAGEPRLAVFCGFDPARVPAVGTYYEFFKRLENGPFQPKCHHRTQESEQRAARRKDCVRPPRRKPEDRAKEHEAEHGQVMKRLVEETEAREGQPLPNDLESLLNSILVDLVVRPSAEQGLIDLARLRVAGDGSVLESDSSPDGERTCDCRSRRIYECDHPRRHSDPDSAWGWDNREKDYAYGYRFFQVVPLDEGHNLPIYVNIGPANTYEPKLAVRAIDRLGKLGLEIREASFDALYDLYAFYRYLVHKGIDYAIPYAVPPAKCVALGESGQTFDAEGSPLCPGGLPMVRHALDEQGRRMYHCPVKRGTHRDGKPVRVVRVGECPRGALCEPDSKMGPILHVADDIDCRIHPRIGRGTAKYKELSKARTTCERSNSMKKEALGLGRAKMRVMSYALIRLALATVLEHTRVWARRLLDGMGLPKPDAASVFV
jgi:hypothetical protein